LWAPLQPAADTPRTPSISSLVIFTLRERAEQEEERRVEAETLGMEVEEPPLFLPTPPFMASEEAE